MKVKPVSANATDDENQKGFKYIAEAYGDVVYQATSPDEKALVETAQRWESNEVLSQKVGKSQQTWPFLYIRILFQCLKISVSVRDYVHFILK